MHDDISNGLIAVAAQLTDAAYYAMAGDRETARARIERAMQLLLERSGSSAQAVARPSGMVRGGLAAWQVRRVKEYIEAHIAQRIRLEELASLLRLSGSHFSRAFKCSVGDSAQTYIMRRRIEYAQGLMLTTRDSLSEIALACGMSDQSHFTRSFRRVVELTPMAWRRSRINDLQDSISIEARA